MRKGWFERVMMAFSDSGTLFGMPSASIELILLEHQEREQLARDRHGIHDDDDDDDDGEGGSRVDREPVAA